jgi:ribosome maturation factor RimP
MKQVQGEAWAAAHAFVLSGSDREEREVTMTTTDDIERIVAPLVAAAGLELVDVELTPVPRVLRVRVDGAGGIDLDVLGPLAKTISHLLDEADAVPGGHYDLEVSSPGLERPLRRPEHFTRAVGQRVRVRTRAGTEGPRRAEGVLLEAGEGGFVLGDREGGERRHVAYDDVERAQTVFDWQAALAAGPSPAGRASRKRRAASRSQAAPRTSEPDTGRERAATS